MPLPLVTCDDPHSLGPVSDDAYIVKFQTIVREGKEIVVGRIKVPTVRSDVLSPILNRTVLMTLSAWSPLACFHPPTLRYKRRLSHNHVQGRLSRCH